eukprot:Protomagalhaensia_sp_Gyna_25__3730@NODE_334_length_3838_cov_597_592788_g261_i0_p3_GENE_NODE_334_length_3838_cov_597_592788_g261_i0NODE_334_length_3838_cov_597_592788_g261_i0_p3_ORF_typecomplete_len160_score21_16GAS/PF13851_6/0_012APG6_N/PF17675_1/0_014VSNARE/PF05008_15/0_062VSNARE/PF05008_15/1_9e03Myosin_tail_1/PF01576_19/0_026YabA/PF06156_13/0_043GCP_N_terminal/PF17681_1/0_068Rabaptin/PF03528_15/0_11NRBF2/PF08961_10/2_4e03NRBF2/PF08961_10/0_68CCDC14/PF15254_6/13CCDC14/PF15254_6/18Enkurin/PF1386
MESLYFNQDKDEGFKTKWADAIESLHLFHERLTVHVDSLLRGEQEAAFKRRALIHSLEKKLRSADHQLREMETQELNLQGSLTALWAENAQLRQDLLHISTTVNHCPTTKSQESVETHLKEMQVPVPNWEVSPNIQLRLGTDANAHRAIRPCQQKNPRA